MNNPEVTTLKYPLFFFLFMLTMISLGMAILGLMIWERSPASVHNMNTTVAYGILSAGIISNVALLGALINIAEKHDNLIRQTTSKKTNKPIV